MKPNEEDLRVARELVGRWRAENASVAVCIKYDLLSALADTVASAIATEREKAYLAGFKDGARGVADETIAKLPAAIASIRAGDKE